MYLFIYTIHHCKVPVKVFDVDRKKYLNQKLKYYNGIHLNDNDIYGLEMHNFTMSYSQ